MKNLYEKDFNKWTQEQASLLRSHSFYKLDVDHLIEEIEGLGASDKRALESHLAIILAHMLKIKYQPEKHTRSWDLSIKNGRFHVKKILRKNPSLNSSVNEFIKDAYFTARLEAANQTDLAEKVFPKKCPWKIDEILSG